LWPGGVETVRQVAPSLNYSIFHGGYFDNVDAVRIEHAPGMITAFQKLDPNFIFDIDQDCAFGGQLNNDSIKICIRQVDRDIAAGGFPCFQNSFEDDKSVVQTL
jgi:hypothetical protein